MGAAVNSDAQCTGKAPLTWAVAVNLLARDKWRDRKRSLYHCPICRAWHLGGKRKKIRMA